MQPPVKRSTALPSDETEQEDHIMFRELDRIKLYISKIKNFEKKLATSHDGVEEKYFPPKEESVASKFIKNTLRHLA